MINRVNWSIVEKLLYQCEAAEIIDTVKYFCSAELLYVFVYNYNWDDGFGIPWIIMSNPYCDLSTALLMFYQADGLRYLED